MFNVLLLSKQATQIWLLLAEGFHTWMWRGLGFVIPFLIVGYVSIKSIVHYALAVTDNKAASTCKH